MTVILYYLKFVLNQADINVSVGEIEKNKKTVTRRVSLELECTTLQMKCKTYESGLHFYIYELIKIYSHH